MKFTRSGERLHDESGLILVFVLVLMVVLLGMLALAVDVGNGRQQRRQAQTAADASALAAAEVIETYQAGFTGAPSEWTLVVNQVKGYAKQNWNVKSTDWSGCTDSGHLAFMPDGSNTCISADFSTWSAPLPGDPINTVLKIRVRLPQRSISSVFGSILGVNSLSTAATATAAVTRTTHTISTSTDFTTPGGPCALCVLSPTGLSLDGQNGDVTITGGGVVVNSTASTAAQLNPNGNVKLTLPCNAQGECNTIGGPGGASSFSGSGFSPAPVTKDPVDDPLADIPQCGNGGLGDGTTTTVPSECPVNVITTEAKKLPKNLSPGVYANGIQGSHHLAAGVYVLKGDMKLSGNDLVEGDGVMFYLACSNYPSPCAANTLGATIDSGTGNGTLRLTAPTTGTFQGLTIFADRNNTGTVSWRGNGTNENGPQSGSSGSIYLKSGTLDLRGNGYTLASMIISKRFTMEGNPSAVTIAYDLSKNYYVVTHHTSTSTSTSYSYDATGLVG